MSTKANHLLQLIHQDFLKILDFYRSSTKEKDQLQILSDEHMSLIRSGFQRLQTYLESTDHQALIAPEIFKLAELSKHLKKNISYEQLVYLSIPIERHLNKSLRDDQWLISSSDRPKMAANNHIPLVFVLHNIRSSFNVGSLFRLADSVGCQKMILVGYTPRPDLDQQLTKTSLGSHESVSWEHAEDIQSVIEVLKKDEYSVAALETSPKSTNLYHANWNPKTAFIVGNERFGLESWILDQCHQVIQIPQFGIKNSLNVAQAMSIAAFEFRRIQDFATN